MKSSVTILFLLCAFLICTTSSAPTRVWNAAAVSTAEVQCNNNDSDIAQLYFNFISSAMSELSAAIINRSGGNAENALNGVLQDVSNAIDPNDKTAHSLRDIAERVSGRLSAATKQDIKTPSSGSTKFDRKNVSAL